jgi:hypothetical protein
MQVKAAETVKSLEITDCEDVCRESCHSDFQHLYAKVIPDGFHEKSTNFSDTLVKYGRNYAFKHIGNADETVVYFDMPPNYTVILKMQTKLKLEANFSHSMFPLICQLTII